MSAPIADESLNEWIELYNNGTKEINVSGFIIGDDKDNDTIEGGLYEGLGTIIPAYGYALITDEATRVYNNFNVSSNAIRLYVDDSSIGNGLKNSGERVYLHDNNGNLIHSITYNETEKGKSFAFLNDSWYEANATPGYNNNGSILYQEEIIGCDWKIEVLLNKTIFENKDEFEWQMRAIKINGNKTNITGRATIQDLFGNIVKEYKPWTNKTATYQKTSTKYSPNLEEGRSYIITTNLDVQCGDIDLENNVDQKTITIRGSSLGNSSFIDIEDIYDLGRDNIAKFGQTIRVKLNVYKGNTNKDAIKVWVENEDDKISKQSKTNIYKKFTESAVTIPIQLKPNCNFKYEDGKYKIKAGGLDTAAEKDIEVEDITDNMCETKLVYKEPSKAKLYYELIDWPLEIENNKEFSVKVRINNNDERDHTIDIWSYVYRGFKSYSGEREANLRHLRIKRRSSREIILRNRVKDAKAGEYNLMIKIIKDNQKTPKKITKKITVVEEIKTEDKKEIIEEKQEKIELKEKDKKDYYTILEATKQPKIVYESSSVKAKKLVVYLFIGLLIMYVGVLTWRR